MGNKIILKLKLNSEDSIIAYEKKNYNTCRVDSRLYLCVGGKKIKIVEDSFCYGFGLQMYYRVYNIKKFDEAFSFGNELKEFYNNMVFNDAYDPNDPDSNPYLVSTDFPEEDYAFAYGRSLDKSTSLYLFKGKNEYKLLFLQLWESEPKKYEVKILNEFSLGEAIFVEWKAIISTEWEKRVKIEIERNGRQQSEEEWQKYFEFMRSDN